MGFYSALRPSGCRIRPSLSCDCARARVKKRSGAKTATNRAKKKVRNGGGEATNAGKQGVEWLG